jgi:hypothetical protein
MSFRKNLLGMVSVILWIGMIPAVFHPMGSRKVVMRAMPSRMLSIQDEEYLKYARFEGGEKAEEILLVSRISADKKNIHVYQEHINATNALRLDKIKLPASYTNFHQKFLIDLEKASLVHDKEDYTDRFDVSMAASNHYWGAISSELTIDRVKSMAYYLNKIYDGYNSQVKANRISIYPDYPIWDGSSLGFIGARIFGIANNGILYLIEPEILKDPISMSFDIKGREDIQTKAGIFHTVKVGMKVADPFLGKLLESYVNSMFVWVEDSNRALVVKIQDFDGVYMILEDIGVWKE